MKWLAVAILLLALIPPQAKAVETTMELFEVCKSEFNGLDGPDDLEKGAKNIGCIAYLRGYIDHMVTVQVFGSDSKELGCAPYATGVTAGQARLMLWKWAKEYPERLSDNPLIFLNDIFLEAFGSCEELKPE